MTKAGKKVWAIQYDYMEGCKQAEEVCLGVPYFNWGPAYVKAVKMVMEGKWTQYWDWNGPDCKEIKAARELLVAARPARRVSPALAKW